MRAWENETTYTMGETRVEEGAGLPWVYGGGGGDAGAPGADTPSLWLA